MQARGKVMALQGPRARAAEAVTLRLLSVPPPHLFPPRARASAQWALGNPPTRAPLMGMCA